MKLTYRFYSILLCIGLLTLGSCSKDDDYTPPVTQTVFVFFPYADQLTYQGVLTNDLTEIKAGIKNARNMDGYRVIVYYGNSANTARLFEYRLNDGIIEEQPIESYTDVNQTSEEYLKGVFSKVRETSPTSTYKMIIGGHGCGWLPSNINYGNVKKSPLKSFGGASTDSLRINTTTFANAMSMATLRPDLIIFDACLMANIETLYDLRSSVKYVIAPPSEQPGSGFPYTDIWTSIIDTTSLQSAYSICKAYKDYYDKNHIGYNNSPANMSVINCEALENIAMAMKAINTDATISAKIHSITSPDILSIQRYDKKDSGVYYDILSYAHTVAGDNNILYNELQTAITQAVLHFVHSGFYLANGNVCYPISSTNTCGLATSDPSVNTSVTLYKDSTTWWKATH